MTNLSNRTQLLKHLLAGALCFALLPRNPAHAEGLAALGAYGADLKQTSVSGLSSGAFMAVQFDVAFSSELVGAGIIAGGPFYCAGLFAPTLPAVAAVTECMSPLGDSGPLAADALAIARSFADKGKIDALKGLARQRVYVFGGTMDKTVTQRVVDQTAQFFSQAGVAPANLKYVSNLAAGHAILTNNPADVPCAWSKDPYINNCGFLQSHDILKWIYGPLNPPSVTAGGRLLAFDQSRFDPQGKATLGPIGYAYVPNACTTKQCRVHVVFHGCHQGERRMGDRYARTTGYNELADTNNLIVLYPQVADSVRNPKGCWDFWGYTSQDDPRYPDFYSRKAPQQAAVMQMVKRLGAARTSNRPTL
ncbi:poly(3-hydroxybutyrate) depolymerase [Chitinimonas arctica]|uniref:Poly(3-hydroxybutyrate) depolymerase n=1 Tax=Chitinimonas arctica TaxID=2594795 RepID=A0A516SJQ8_9NEIS|nr:PHB depolymerase family esterase [Chitinimonas arctica]QDQ28374.1 poly(3-hydroxybutyrate) depolymerase [Chitinimonas arctica]